MRFRLTNHSIWQILSLAAVTFISGVLLLAYGMTAYLWFTQIPLTKPEACVHALVFLPIVVGPCLLLLQVARRKAHTKRQVVPTFIGGIIFLGWLAYDEPPPPALALPPVFTEPLPEAGRSHALLLALPDHIHAVAEPLGNFPLPSRNLNDPKTILPWVEWVRTNSAEVEAIWMEAERVVEWLNLAANEPIIADLLPPLAAAPYYEPLSHVSNLVCARAYLLARSGQSDEAAALLVQLNELGVKLETHGRSMLRRLVAVSLQNQAIGTTRILLDEDFLSATARRTLRAGLSKSQAPEEGAYQLILSEYHLFAFTLKESMPAGFSTTTPRWKRLLSHPRACLLINVNLTLRLHQDYLAHLALQAKERRFGEKPYFAPLKPIPQKNLLGYLLLQLTHPSILHVAQGYWDAHDERQALLARL